MSDITLSPSQEQIVNSTARNIIVTAGAGSGKTRVLTERVKKLLQDGVDPRGVVVITFTNMAAEELQERLQGIPNADKCFIGTIHSLANAILSTRYEYTLYSEQIQNNYMKFLINRYAKYATYDDYDTLMDAYRQLHIGKCKYDDILRYFKPKVLDELYILLEYEQAHGTLDYRDYPQTVRTMSRVDNVITFDELIERCSKYFSQHNTHINYLFVDELQDVGTLEFNFLLELDAKYNFFIGDDYQAIYGFKGGDVQIFLSLLKDPDWTPYYLEDNYRNGAIILQYANSIICHAKDILSKKSVCKSGKLGSVDIQSTFEFSNFLSSLNKDNTSYVDWFILTRSNADLDFVVTELTKQNVPVVSFKKSEITKAEKDEALSKNAVKVFTIHTAKGLESRNVALYGHFPLKPTMSTKSEEIKVFYVGITRAQEKLIIFNIK